MKTTRSCAGLLALLLCLSAHGLAQSNAKPDYRHQHKSAQNYQKSVQKRHRKQEKAQAKAAKAYRKQHASNPTP
jgi:Flp pilus assembly protein TadB